MMPEMEFERYELKFYINGELYEVVREMMEPYMKPDPYSLEAEGRRYTVRSLYLDNDLWDSYYENLDGLEVRRKLRIRSYGEGEESCFLEIKKKINSSVMKKRHVVHRHIFPSVMTGDVDMEGEGGLFLKNFCFLTAHLNLKPKILIEYEREAYRGICAPKLRVTFDRAVRAAMCARTLLYPELAQWMEVTGEDLVILELKFNGLMPRFLQDIVRELNLGHEPISKYCCSVRACDLL